FPHDLHSFPTRRSSDLFGQAAAVDRQLGFSRQAENEADRVGLQMLERAGYDPSGMSAMFKRLMDVSRLNEGPSNVYASTHPLSRSEEHTSELQSRENLV